MDRFIAWVAGLPRWTFGLAAIAALVETFPGHAEARDFLGLPLNTTLTQWLGNLVVVVVLLGVVIGVFFLVRAVASYLEEGRWPTKALGVELRTAEEALGQVDRDADDLPDAANSARYFERRLKRANEAIRYLHAELERARGAPVNVEELRRRQAEENAR